MIHKSLSLTFFKSFGIDNWVCISMSLYAGSSFAQNIADDYFEEDDGYTAAHQEMPANHAAEDASGGYQFKNDDLLSEQENPHSDS